MKGKTVYELYRYSIILMVFLIPSGFYGLTIAVLPFIFFCWIYFKDYKRILSVIKRPEVFLPVLLYFYIAGGIFFSNNFSDALSSLSTKIPFLLFPLIIGSSSIIDKRLIDEAEDWFVLSVCLSLIIAITYALVDVAITHKTSILIGESIYNKFSWYGLTRVFYNWHPTYVSMFANLAISIRIQRFKNNIGNKKLRFRTAIVVVFLTVFIFLLNSMIGIITFIFLVLYFAIKYFNSLHLSFPVKLLFVFSMCFMCFSFFYFD